MLQATNYPRFESVYDWVPGYGRTKSISYRMWKGAKRAVVGVVFERRNGLARKFRRAVKKLRMLRGL